MRPEILIFDLGGVLIRYTPEFWRGNFIKKAGVEPEGAKNLFSHDAFFEYERGKITNEEFFKIVQREIGYPDTFLNFKKDFCEESFELDYDMYNLINDIKRIYGRTVELWMLSNINEIHYEYIYKKWPGVFNSFFKVFLSFKIGLRKPDPEIYRYILREGRGHAYTAIFIDDVEENCLGAKSAGIHPITFRGKKELVAILKNFEISLP